MLRTMPRSVGKKKKKEPISSGDKARPRTVRLSRDDDRWVDEQPEGFTAVIESAVRLYRQHRDNMERQLLDSVS